MKARFPAPCGVLLQFLPLNVPSDCQLRLPEVLSTYSTSTREQEHFLREIIAKYYFGIKGGTFSLKSKYNNYKGLTDYFFRLFRHIKEFGNEN